MATVLYSFILYGALLWILQILDYVPFHSNLNTSWPLLLSITIYCCQLFNLNKRGERCHTTWQGIVHILCMWLRRLSRKLILSINAWRKTSPYPFFFLKWHLRTTNVMFRTIFGTHVEIFEKKNQGERGGKGFKKCSGKQT